MIDLFEMAIACYEIYNFASVPSLMGMEIKCSRSGSFWISRTY
jgi:hypothetical protein